MSVKLTRLCDWGSEGQVIDVEPDVAVRLVRNGAAEIVPENTDRNAGRMKVSNRGRTDDR